MTMMKNRDFVGNIAWALAIVMVAVVGVGLRKMALVDPDTVTRTVIGANGLMIAWMGNRMPKSFVPNACARRVRRAGGWSMALSGIVYAGLFAFAPLSVAYAGGAMAVFGGIAFTMGYCFLMRARRKANVA